jgi:iron(III) transport system ATP-binding protein
MQISLHNLTKRFGNTTVLRDVSLEIADRELFFLLGPSGCGKTTLLRLIAGFYQPDGGELRFGPRRMNDVPPHERNTGMVFQSYALWPHMTVFQNVAYGLEIRKVPAPEKLERVNEALRTVRMEAFATRSPNQLSGGQQQRVALARALVIRPDVLLLDEPLSNLDTRLRLELRDEIRRIHGETKITTVYVTHDQQESLSLADRLAVLKDGVVEQVGDPRSVYRRPANRFVADFIGETNWIEGEVAAREVATTPIRTAWGILQSEGDSGMAAGTPVWVGFRPEAVQLTDHSENSFASQLCRVNYLGAIEEYVLRAPDGTLFKAFARNPAAVLPTGHDLRCSVRRRDLLVLPRTESLPGL